MKLFEGKSPTERNKIIAALVLGAMALLALTYTFGGSFFGGSFFGGSRTKVNVAVTASPTPTASPRSNTTVTALPSDEEMNDVYTTTPVVYSPGSFYAPDAGRNIFAFYEPPPPTPYVPTPTPTPYIEPPKTPVPTPTPEFLVGYVTPQSVFAGSKTFRLEVNGDRFTPESLIYLNGSQLPTTFISQQKLVADVPSNFISNAGAIYIIVRTPDGSLYSNQVALTVQAPPVPQFQYIGMIARQRFNNDTAYFQEQGKQTPFGARLNDVIGGRFRLISISSEKTIFEDVNLGFKHQLALFRPPVGGTTTTGAGQNNPNPDPNNPNRRNVNDFQGFPNNITPNYIPPSVDEIAPGIPRYIPPPTPIPQETKRSSDDDGDGR